MTSSVANLIRQVETNTSNKPATTTSAKPPSDITTKRPNGPTTEMTGAVKWFDSTKGYGFMVPSSGGPDVLVHISIVERFGRQALKEGATITCEVIDRQGKLSAYSILSIDDSTAVIVPKKDSKPKAKPVGSEQLAQVKWFNRLRGFGFLTCGEDTPDIFIHMETLRACNMPEIREGDEVWVLAGQGPKGLVAIEVREREALKEAA